MKKVCFLFIIFMLFTTVKAEEIKLASNAKSAILIEPTTGEILF